MNPSHVLALKKGHNGTINSLWINPTLNELKSNDVLSALKRNELQIYFQVSKPLLLMIFII